MKNHPLPLPETGMTMDRSNAFGIERGGDGKLRAVGPDGIRARTGVSDNVAQNLALSYQPDSDDIAQMLTDGKEAEVLNEGFQYTLNWDRMAPGEMRNEFMRDHPTIKTCSLSQEVTVEIMTDGLFYPVAEDSAEAPGHAVIGVPADVAAEIMMKWTRLIKAEHSTIKTDRWANTTSVLDWWNVEAMQRMPETLRVVVSEG